jgi:hypothetical protein
MKENGASINETGRTGTNGDAFAESVSKEVLEFDGANAAAKE